jgi:hypothetical protein
MKKFTMNMAAIVLPLLFTGLFTSCKKENLVEAGPESLSANPSAAMRQVKNVPFNVDLLTWYRIAPTDIQTVKLKGETYSVMGFFPGSGVGTASELGACKNYFNQLAYASGPITPTTIPEGSFNAPAIDALTFPVLGLPLPFIQANDFSSFASYHAMYNFPSKYHGKTVNSILLDEVGNAIYTSVVEGEGGTEFIPPTAPSFQPKVRFWGKGLIVGGRAKFDNAKGQFDFGGIFNLVNPNDATYTATGSMSY